MLFHCPAKADSLDIETAFMDACSEYWKIKKNARKSLPKMQLAAKAHAAA